MVSDIVALESEAEFSSSKQAVSMHLKQSEAGAVTIKREKGWDKSSGCD